MVYDFPFWKTKSTLNIRDEGCHASISERQQWGLIAQPVISTLEKLQLWELSFGRDSFLTKIRRVHTARMEISSASLPHPEMSGHFPPRPHSAVTGNSDRKASCRSPHGVERWYMGGVFLTVFMWPYCAIWVQNHFCDWTCQRQDCSLSPPCLP